MRATQSSTALAAREVSGQFAALEYASRRLDTGMVDEAAVAEKSAASAAGGDFGRGERRRNAGALRVAEGAGLAHDAGNLLGALSLYSELLAAPGVLNEGYREYAEELRLLSRRSHAMIARLVEYARSCEAEAEEVMTVLPAVVSRCHGLLSRVARRRVEVAFGTGASMRVRVAAEVVERILTNLVKNAAESMPEDGGSITVSVASVADGWGRRVVMTVSDTGRGMTEEARRALGEATAADASGRGLGFRVVRELVAMSDGCLTVASRPCEGTSVAVAWAAELIAMEEPGATRRVMRGGRERWIAC